MEAKKKGEKYEKRRESEIRKRCFVPSLHFAV
jgi:hypothetical protein